MTYLYFSLGFLFSAFRELSEHAKESKFLGWGNWWNTGTSWANKYNWNPSWLFKSAMVWVTDAEHFFQMLSLITVLFAILPQTGGLESVFYFYAGNVLAGFLKRFTNIS